MKLNERQRFALLWLDLETSPEDPLYGGRGAYAHRLGDKMQTAGLLDGTNKRHGASQGAANVLVALRRLGLARNSTPGGEAFQAVEWGITAEGARVARKLRGICPDGGACHHDCALDKCFRVRNCSPLSSYGEDWRPEDVERYGGRPTTPTVEDVIVRG